jgi:hypothetical protein
MPTKAQAKGRTYQSAKEWREKNDKVQVNAQVDPELRKKLRMFAAAREITISEMISEMIEALGKEKEEGASKPAPKGKS